jgi:hypothetical protein
MTKTDLFFKKTLALVLVFILCLGFSFFTNSYQVQAASYQLVDDTTSEFNLGSNTNTQVGSNMIQLQGGSTYFKNEVDAGSNGYMTDHGDLDGDGDIDFISDMGTTSFYWYENNGDGSSWVKHEIDNTSG